MNKNVTANYKRAAEGGKEAKPLKEEREKKNVFFRNSKGLLQFQSHESTAVRRKYTPKPAENLSFPISTPLADAAKDVRESKRNSRRICERKCSESH